MAAADESESRNQGCQNQGCQNKDPHPGEQTMAVQVTMYLHEDDKWQHRSLYLEVLRYLREEVHRGDLFLCYEVDRKKVVGVARAASDGRDAGLGSLVDFCPRRQAVRLSSPLTRKPDLDHILAFSPRRGRGTVQRIDSDEFRRLRRLMLRKNPEQRKALARLFREA